VDLDATNFEQWTDEGSIVDTGVFTRLRTDGLSRPGAAQSLQDLRSKLWCMRDEPVTRVSSAGAVAERSYIP